MLTRPEHDRVTNALVTLGRKALGKSSTFFEEDEHGKQQWKSISNIAVRKKTFGVASSFVNGLEEATVLPEAHEASSFPRPDLVCSPW